MNKHKQEYERLKIKADQAEQMYHQTQSAIDWEWFMHCEHEVSCYAYEHEKEIWDDCKDNSISIE